MAKSRYNATDIVVNGEDPPMYSSYSLPSDFGGYSMKDLAEGVTTYTHVWCHGDRLDKIAAKQYGVDDYWWVIALVNGISFPLSIPIGSEIRVPLEVDGILSKLNAV